MKYAVYILFLTHWIAAFCLAAFPESQQRLNSYMARLTEQARQQGPINPTKFDNDMRFVYRSLALAEEGDFPRALQKLRSVDLAPFTSRKRNEIKGLISTLEEINDPNRVFLESYADFYKYSYRDWFEERLAPIAYVWQRDFSTLEKYRFLETVFYDLDNAVGLIRVLEATVDLPGIDPDTAANKLLSLGWVYHRNDRLEDAEQTWLRVLSDYDNEQRDWHAAAYYLANLEERKNCPDQALTYYRMVIQSPAEDKEPVVNLFDNTSISTWKHEAALAVSYIYQSKWNYVKALRYTIDAKFKYPYQTWCGTCLEAQNIYLYWRMTYLFLIVFGLPVLLIIIFVVVVKRFRRKHKSLQYTS